MSKKGWGRYLALESHLIDPSSTTHKYAMAGERVYLFIIYKVVKYRNILMKYIVYFIFSLEPECKYNFFWITSDFSIDLLQCTSELKTPITFLFVNENIKCGYSFS